MFGPKGEEVQRKIEYLQSDVRYNFYPSPNICYCHDDQIKKDGKDIKHG